jgi:membrane fusion protein, multidrug efflux system
MTFPRSLLSAIIPLFLSSCGGDRNEPQANPSVERAMAVAGYTVVPRDLSRTVRVSGNVEPLEVITLASRMGGLVHTLHAEEGDRVSGGQVVASLDVEEQEAELERAEAVLEQTRSNYERIRELYERDLSSRAEYETARAEHRVAESEVRLRRTHVRFGEIRAPKDAVVTRKYVEAGDAVSVNDPVFEIADISTLVIRVGVSELDAVYLDRGDEAGVRIDAYGGREFSGRIRRIFPGADPGSRLVTVEIELAGIPGGVNVRPGNLARVSLSVDRRAGVLAVPSESLLASTYEETFVYVVEDDHLRRRSVVPGVQRRNLTEITEGLNEGDVIVATNPTNLAEGARVTITQWRE